VDASEPRAFGFQWRKGFVLGFVVNGYAEIVVGIHALLKAPIVQVAAHGKMIFQPGYLTFGGIAFVLVGFFGKDLHGAPAQTKNNVYPYNL
jgi:hypothetical protein